MLYTIHIYVKTFYICVQILWCSEEKDAPLVFLLLFSPVIVTRPEFMDLLIRTEGKNQRRWVLWNVASRHRWMNKKRKKEEEKRRDETQRQRFRNIWRDKRCVGLFAKLLNLHCTSLTQISVWKSEPATEITVLQGYRRTRSPLVKVPVYHFETSDKTEVWSFSFCHLCLSSFD